LLTVTLGQLLVAQPGLAADSPGASRLREYSGERRRILLGKLEEFDSLPPAERQRIRALDQKLNAMGESERANYLAVLHRYHVWLNELSEAERAEINEASAENRIAVISRIKAERATKTPTPPLLLLAADFGGFSAFDLANRVKVYLALDTAMKSEVNRLQEPARSRRLQELGRQLKVAAVPRITLAQEEQAFEGVRRSTSFPMLKRPEELVKMGRLKQRLAEAAYFEENPPEKVQPENLVRFAESLPVWTRTLIDPMPPDEARRQLRVLYRLIYPAPSEMPGPSPAPGSSKPQSPAGATVPRPPTSPAAPF
jgi:hypothetical protein